MTMLADVARLLLVWLVASILLALTLGRAIGRMRGHAQALGSASSGHRPGTASLGELARADRGSTGPANLPSGDSQIPQLVPVRSALYSSYVDRSPFGVSLEGRRPTLR
jgi:hypothetical protein